MKTAFTVSVDYREGLTTGISAEERANTVRALANGNCAADDFLRPGHVFTFVAGLSVAHLHQHVFTRPADTPPHVPWHDADSPAAP